MYSLYLVIRLSLGDVNYIEEWNSLDECNAAVQRLETLHQKDSKYRCMIVFYTGDKK